MSLNQLSGTIKKYLAALAVLIVLVAIAYLLWPDFSTAPSGDQKFGKLPQVAVETIISDKVKIESNISTGININPPSLLNVYKEKAVVSSSKFAKQFGFKGKSKKVSGYLIWQNKRKILKIDQETKKFTFTNQTNIKKLNLKKESAQKIARDLLTDLGLVDKTAKLEVKRTERKYVGVWEVLDVPDNNIYNVYIFEFAAKINSYKLINESGNDELFEVWVGMDKQIVKASGTTKIVGFSDLGTYPSKPLSQAFKDLRANSGKIISLSGQPQKFDRINTAYTGATIRYLVLSKSNGFIQPVYVFEGRTAGKSGEVKVLTVIEALDKKIYR